MDEWPSKDVAEGVDRLTDMVGRLVQSMHIIAAVLFLMTLNICLSG